MVAVPTCPGLGVEIGEDYVDSITLERGTYTRPPFGSPGSKNRD
jgi:hypothetical protein